MDFTVCEIPSNAKGVSMRTHVCEIGSIPVRWHEVTIQLGRSREPLGGTGASHLDEDVSDESGKVSLRAFRDRPVLLPLTPWLNHVESRSRGDSLCHVAVCLLASGREGALDGGTAEAHSCDLGNWLMMEPGAAAPTDFCVLSYYSGGWPWPQVLVGESQEASGWRKQSRAGQRGWNEGGGR